MLFVSGYKKAHFVGHSLGTVVCAWMLENSKTVAGLGLLDPITFLTYHSELAYSES